MILISIPTPFWIIKNFKQNFVNKIICFIIAIKLFVILKVLKNLT